MICLYIDPNTESTISTHEPKSTEWFGNGTCILLPSECKVTEKANAMYSLRMVHPITDDERWKELKVGRVIRANVPVRDNPQGQSDETVTRNVYAINPSKKSTKLYKTETGSGKIKTCKKGTRFIAIDETGSSRYYVMLEEGGTIGWVKIDDLVPDGTVTETPAESGKESSPNGVICTLSGEQFFRIQSVEVNSYDKTVSVDAVHVFYDMNYMYMPLADTKTVTTVSNLIKTMNTNAGFYDNFRRPYSLNRREYVHLVTAVTDDIVMDTSGRSYTDILLNETDGVVTKIGGRIIRDGYEAYILPMVVRDLGYTIKYAKNLQGVTMSTDISSVVTQIKSKYKLKNGKYSANTFTETSSKAYQYPVLFTKCKDYGLQVGKDSLTTAAQVEAKLTALMQQEFSRDKVDEPTISATIDFSDLGATDEYAQYKALNALHIFDTVTITDNEILEEPIKVRIVGYTWDCLTENYESIELGDISSHNRSLVGYSLSRIASNIRDNSADVIVSQAAADEAQTTATEKAKVTSASSAPSSASSGDYWIDTYNGSNELKQYNGTTWVSLQDGAIGTANTNALQAKSDAEEAQNTADNADAKAQAAQDDVDAVAERVGTLEVSNESIKAEVKRGKEEGSNVTQTMNEWSVKVYASASVAYRNYVRYGIHRTNETAQAFYEKYVNAMYDGYIQGKKVDTNDVLYDYELSTDFDYSTTRGKWCMLFATGNLVSTGCGYYVCFLVDNSEAYSGTMNFGFSVKCDNEDIMSINVKYLVYDDDTSTATSENVTISASAWTDVKKTFSSLTAGGKKCLVMIEVPTLCSASSGDYLAIADVYIEKNDASATNAWSEWVHTPADGDWRSVSITRGNIEEKDENGTLGYIPSCARLVATLEASGWDEASGNIYEVSIPNLRSDMDVIVTPDAGYIEYYTAAGIVCGEIAAGSLTFYCTTVPAVDIDVNVLILGGAATWSST